MSVAKAISRLAQHGNARRHSISAHQPFLLTEANALWFIQEGEVEIYGIVLDHNLEIKGTRKYLYTAKQGDLICGLPLQADATTSMHFLAISQSATLAILPKKSFYKSPNISSHEVATFVETWLLQVIKAIFDQIPPRNYTDLKAGETLLLNPNEVVYPPRKGVLWVKPEIGTLLIHSASPLNQTMFPVVSQLWLSSNAEASKIQVLATEELYNNQMLSAALFDFQSYLQSYLEEQYQASVKAEQKRITERIAIDDRKMKESLSTLSKTLNEQETVARFAPNYDNHLLAASQFIGNEMGIEIKQSLSKSNAIDPLYDIAQASKIRMRKVILRDNWWKTENGHLLAFTAEGNHPVALLQSTAKQYTLKNPADKSDKKVTRKIAQDLNPVAYMFLYPFDEKISSVRKLWDFAKKGLQRDATLILIAALVGSVLGLLSPILSGILFDDVIPQADRDYLFEIVGIMIMVTIITTLFDLVQGVLLLRVEAKTNLNIQAALIDHILRLPVSFFKQFSSGDLTERALSINTIRSMITNTVLTAVLGGMFSVVNLVLLFYYDMQLAWVAMGLAIFAVLYNVYIGYTKLTYYRKMIAVEGKLQGMLFEFISGIAKIRVAGAEKRVFSIWAEQFAKIKKLAFGAGKQQNKLEVFNNAYPILTNMLFFTFLYLFYMQTKEAGAARLPITVGAFMAFITAFRQFLYECLDMGYAIITSMYIIPMYERVKPLLEAEPESSLASEDPGVLRGEIEVSHLNFHYDKDSPLILKDVSVHIKAGEMVAFVGPSGSGKSTLMRILLGFEKPASGSVYYDGQDLSSLDVNLVRRQIGVVLQHGELMAGDIFSNIIGNANLSLEDAWEAARLAGLEEDIEQMPMGMHTVISEGAGTFSGGQRQRLMIARAIVHKPRILFMDEATSALDNRTQQIVTESLERLRATRIIIAHRLSTIMNADRIYVMEAGRVVQQGTYEELLQTEGVFKELAERQLV